MSTSGSQNSRIIILDVLRGFAIVAIMLLHNIEHFDVYHFPDHLPDWMKTLDQKIWISMFFLFGGKAYAIFALLFGVTFAIQLRNQEQRGQTFRARFAWRMVLLFGFGLLNSAFFQGDVLTIYAVIGLLLIPVTKLQDKWILLIAAFMMLLPVEMIKLVYAFKNPSETVGDPVSWTYFGRMWEYIPGKSMIKTIWGNLTNGKVAVLRWNWENGRFFTIFALFLFGYLLGKKELFRWNEVNERFWKKVLLVTVSAFIPLYVLQRKLGNLIESDIIRRSVETIEAAWTNFAFMFVLVAGITIIFYKTKMQKPLMYFSSFGKMSLSNYIIQSIIGSTIYYGYGFGVYQYTGATYGILIGIGLTFLMGKFCTWWAKNFKHGPFETLWHKATWIGVKGR